MTKIELTKTAVNFIVGAGTTKIVAQTIKSNTNPKNALESVEIVAGSVALGCLVTDVTRSYTDAKIDAIAAWWNENVKK